MRKKIIQPAKPLRLYSDSEACKVFAFCAAHEHDPYWRDKCFLWRLIWGTGLRESEALALTKDDCLPDGRILVNRSKTGLKRTVVVSPELRPYYLAKLPKVEQRLFGDVKNRTTLLRWWWKLEEAAGIEHIYDRGPHAGRHSYATWELATRRLNATEAMTQLGHTDITMTTGLYAHAITMLMYEENKTPAWWGVALPAQKLRLVTAI